MTVVNCFTLSAYAPFAVAKESAADDLITHVSALRRSEDESFAQRIASLEMRELGLDDAPQRLQCGLDEICSRTLEPSDTALSAIRLGIEKEQRREQPDAIVLPLALGNHVDHVATREALLPIASAGACAFYEDLPYAGRPEVMPTIEQVANAIGVRCGQTLSPLLIGEPGDVPAKRTLAALYRSQIKGEEADEIAGYAARYGGQERLWVNAAWQALFAERTSGCGLLGGAE